MDKEPVFDNERISQQIEVAKRKFYDSLKEVKRRGYQPIFNFWQSDGESVWPDKDLEQLRLCEYLSIGRWLNTINHKFNSREGVDAAFFDYNQVIQNILKEVEHLCSWWKLID